jgi:hypothetical protein
MMKSIAIATTVLLLSAGMASAAPGYKQGHGSHAGKHRTVGHLTFTERLRIARSRARLARLKRRARADGRVTRRERVRLIRATKRHRALVRKEHRD